ncbi:MULTISPECIES: hypothetical protein [Pseudomonas]|uniref:Uncharacterized protein n=1 Tax=Pseudomonas nitroreducens TaxID=46680 RepID=A0A6G6J8P1_PSENT|nr:MULTISPECIES: hypothetical protein [Pseudomonas]MDU4254070.1 hypothetical protein [Pseudomonas sp.]QIE91573.1 hypothetical protein G5B91_35160 [Pseudomonas nitroreducens]
MTGQILSFKPHLQFQDTCGVPLDSMPSQEPFRKAIAGRLGIAPAALHTESQCLEAGKKLFSTAKSPEEWLADAEALVRATAESILLSHKGRIDPKGRTAIAVAKELLAGRHITRERKAQIERLMESSPDLVHAEPLQAVRAGSSGEVDYPSQGRDPADWLHLGSDEARELLRSYSRDESKVFRVAYQGGIFDVSFKPDTGEQIETSHGTLQAEPAQVDALARGDWWYNSIEVQLRRQDGSHVTEVTTVCAIWLRVPSYSSAHEVIVAMCDAVLTDIPF